MSVAGQPQAATTTLNTIQQAHRIGQAIWLDYVRRGLIKSGELKRLIDLGVSGLTANPTILEKAIIGSTDYDEALPPMARAGKKNEAIYETLAIEDIQATADLLRPLYDQSKGEHGYASLEISPLLAYDTMGSIKESMHLFFALARPNVMVKVPATQEGIPAIRQLTAEGINVNITLIFSLEVYRQVREAYMSGLEELLKKGGDLSRVASVASFFLSRIDTMVDNQLEERIKKGEDKLKPLMGTAAVASARIAYQDFTDSFGTQRFATLRANGARVQRPLWASTSTKNPAYGDLKYVEPLIGPDTVNTLPPATINAFLDHGRAALTICQGLAESRQALTDLQKAGINLKAVTARLTTDGVRAFVESYDKLLAGIEEKKKRLQEMEFAPPSASLGKYDADIDKTLADLQQQEVTGRIWRKDYTVWKPRPTEIADRLGWLTVTDLMQERAPGLQSFARDVKEAGFTQVVLLGMGGSSLGAETLNQVFGSATGFPKMIVLDSILPPAVRAVTESIDPRHTLFLVSSKSGTTAEPLALFIYFQNLVAARIGKKEATRNFVAITDPGTPLADTAEKEKFRRVFLNPPDIGGRYSVLSYFGLAPAALLGIDIPPLLEHAERAKEGCASSVAARDNPGAWLGACLGTLAKLGRDKLTLVTSPSLHSFGLWVEQLIAESTGKEGKGIVPVIGEPLASTESYGADRLFIYLRHDDDDNTLTDVAIESLKTAGQPVVTRQIPHLPHLGAEFYEWEFATAVAGAILGINPFDQPNVQASKDATHRFLHESATARKPVAMSASGSLPDLYDQAREGKYLAIMASMRQTPELDGLLNRFRHATLERYHIATTLGYGPRFLHSTGQLHKGGPNTGLFLQITSGHSIDIPIPGQRYTFGMMADAQALGDFEVLRAGHLPAVRIHCPQDAEKDIVTYLTNELGL